MKAPTPQQIVDFIDADKHLTDDEQAAYDRICEEACQNINVAITQRPEQFRDLANNIFNSGAFTASAMISSAWASGFLMGIRFEEQRRDKEALEQLVKE